MSEAEYLERGIQALRQSLEAAGFSYSAVASGTSSAGPFATGAFTRGALEIGLIVRSRNMLGGPNYTRGHGYAGHEDLFWALGREGEARLVSGEFLEFVDKEGDDAFAALAHDLERVVLPALEQSESNFIDALDRAHKKFQRRLSGQGRRPTSRRS